MAEYPDDFSSTPDAGGEGVNSFPHRPIPMMLGRLLIFTSLKVQCCVLLRHLETKIARHPCRADLVPARFGMFFYAILFGIRSRSVPSIFSLKKLMIELPVQYIAPIYVSQVHFRIWR